jgi:hypothetical protein
MGGRQADHGFSEQVGTKTTAKTKYRQAGCIRLTDHEPKNSLLIFRPATGIPLDFFWQNRVDAAFQAGANNIRRHGIEIARLIKLFRPTTTPAWR